MSLLTTGSGSDEAATGKSEAPSMTGAAGEKAERAASGAGTRAGAATGAGPSGMWQEQAEGNL